MAGRADEAGLNLLGALFGQSLQRTYQMRSWANLPILNEWARTMGVDDPVEFHREHWNVRLICPAGGEYRWDEQYRTMYSTAAGHPAVPESGETLLPPLLRRLKSIDLGVTFEGDGLRAGGAVERQQE